MSELGVAGTVETRGAAPPWAAAMTLGALICFVAAAALLWANRPRQAEVKLIEPLSHARLEAGFALYGQHCSACHGRFLSGAPGWRTDPELPPALNETGHAARHGDLELYRRVAFGARGRDGRVTMPAFGGTLSESEIVTLISYVAAWWPEAELRRRALADWTSPAICGPGAVDQS